MTSGQVTRSEKPVKGHPNFNFLYAPVQLTVFDRFPLNFQDVLSSSSCITYSSLFNVTDLRSVRGHDVVMLSLWENIQITPIRKILDIRFVL